MKHPHTSWKLTGGLTALALAGLLANPAARAELMDFETSVSLLDIPDSYGFNVNSFTPAAYQPIPYVHVTYSGSYLFPGIYWFQSNPLKAYIQFDHTTGSYGGTHNMDLGANDDTKPLVYIFDQPVYIPSLFVGIGVGVGGDASQTNVVVRAYADAAGSSLLSSTTVPINGRPSWLEFTGLTASGTNIMRLEVAGTGNNNAVVDDMTIYGPTYGALQSLQFQLAPAGTLQLGTTYPPVVLAKYASVTNDVTTWATFTSSDTSVATVPEQAGVVTAVSPGTVTITATFGGLSAYQTVTVSSLPTAATLVTFNNATNYTSATVTNLALSALSYNPIPNVSCRWTNVTMFNGGPDHTVGVLGYTNWVAAQSNSTLPQIYTFNKAMSLPSLWLTTLAGVADGGSNVVTIKAYSNTNGTALLGTDTVTTPTHGGPGGFQWVQCTDLDSPTYNGLIQRVEISAPGNAQVDDMAAVLNYGTLTNLALKLPLTTLLPGMSRQLSVTNQYATRSNIVVTATALYSSSDPSVATVSTAGRVQAVGPGTATISAFAITNSATAQGVTNSLAVTVTALPANATLVTFNDGGWPEDMYNFGPIALSYEPVPDLFISYPYNATNFIGVSLYNGVPGAVISGTAGAIADHTTGVMPTTTGGTVPAGLSGGNNYTAVGTNAVVVFNRPVGIPSVYLANLFGTTTRTTNVIVRAWSDAAGTVQIYSNSVPTLRPTNTFSEFTGLASVGNTIMRVSFASTNWASFDDMTLVAPPLGALQAVHLQLPQTNVPPGSWQYAGAFADYANVSNVNVTAGCGTVYTSSDTSILTVSTAGTGVVVQAVAPGSATLTATLGALSDSATVFVSNGALTNLTLQLPANSLVAGDSEQATVLGDYQYNTGVDVTTNAAYGSSDPTVVTVSAGGLVTAVGPGSATVSASLENLTNSVAVTVTALGALTDLHLQLAATSLLAGVSEQATVLADYEHKAGADVTAEAAYSSTDPTVVSVSAGGLVTAVAPGSATVSATLGDLMRSVTLTVTTPVTLHIWPLGDSLTYGYPHPGGYRAPLYQALTNAGFNVNYVGSMVSNAIATLPQPDHDGHNGYRIDQIDANYLTYGNSLDASPDLILLIIGGNDYIQGYQTTTATNRLDTLISHLTAAWPKARLLLGNIPVVSNNLAGVSGVSAGYLAYLTNYNPLIPGIVANHQALGQRVFFVDVYDSYGLADLAGGEGVHPAQSGYDKMATNAWFRAITNIVTGQLLDFNTSLPTNNLNASPIPSFCQPIPNLTITCQNVGLRNTGPDHTTGVSGGNRYNAYQYNAAAPQVFLFDKAVAVPSLWLTTDWGGNGASLQVTVNAYADTNGTSLLSSSSVTTAAHPPGAGYVWTQSAGLAALGPNVRRLEFASDGNAQVDDLMLVVTTNWGPAPSALVTFNDGLPPDSLLFQLVPDSYQPVPGLVIGYPGLLLYNGAYGGPDHTTGVTGGNRYFAYGYLTNAAFTFSQPVSIPSVWLTTTQGGQTGQSSNVIVKAYADAAGTILLSSNSVATPLPAATWMRYSGLAPLGTVIQRVEFSSTGLPAIDDMSLNLASSATPGISLSLASPTSLSFNWPLTVAGYLLESSPVLGPGAAWIPVSGSPALVGTNYQLTLPVGDGAAAAYFRLHQQ